MKHNTYFLLSLSYHLKDWSIENVEHDASFFIASLANWYFTFSCYTWGSTFYLSSPVHFICDMQEYRGTKSNLAYLIVFTHGLCFMLLLQYVLLDGLNISVSVWGLHLDIFQDIDSSKCVCFDTCQSFCAGLVCHVLIAWRGVLGISNDVDLYWHVHRFWVSGHWYMEWA
jgi:hypothetical protein